MSVQGDLETAVAGVATGAIAGLTSILGVRTLAQIEGDARTVMVRVASSSGSRLSFGQTEFTDQVEMTFIWPASVDRDTTITEFEAFTAALTADNKLSGSVLGLLDCWVSDWTRSDSFESAVTTIAATIETRRID